jgi:hypothetical protein
MTKTNLELIVRRKSESYCFRFEPNIETFANNVKNNCKDTLILLKDGIEVFKCSYLQTVANYPNADVMDTVRPGKFHLKCFVRAGISFADPADPARIRIHAVINALDLDQERIDSNAMQMDDGIYEGRWLLHSTFLPRTRKDAFYAYSKGCFIFQKTQMLDDFNRILTRENVKPGDVIPGTLTEES